MLLTGVLEDASSPAMFTTMASQVHGVWDVCQLLYGCPVALLLSEVAYYSSTAF
jgi:hypothetical protein